MERAVRAQFGTGFRQLGALRRRRNELEYPERPDDDATQGEATDAVANAEAILAAASELLDQVGQLRLILGVPDRARSDA